MSPSKKQPRLDAPHLALLHIRALREAKLLYKQADAALDALVEKKKTGSVIQLPAGSGISAELRGKKFRLVDRFADRNSIAVGQNARRHELKEVTEP